jgi:hypothetical protein
MNDDLIKKADIQRIASEGARIYAAIKSDYDPKENGKFLAIDIDTEKTYLANSSAEAIELARADHPDTVFYLVKIGFDTAESVARSFAHRS